MLYLILATLWRYDGQKSTREIVFIRRTSQLRVSRGTCEYSPVVGSSLSFLDQNSYCVSVPIQADDEPNPTHSNDAKDGDQNWKRRAPLKSAVDPPTHDRVWAIALWPDYGDCQHRAWKQQHGDYEYECPLDHIHYSTTRTIEMSDGAFSDVRSISLFGPHILDSLIHQANVSTFLFQNFH